jgi:Uncharacterized low-complexity proteins
MNKYIGKFLNIVFQNKHLQEAVPVPSQPVPTSPDGWRAYWQAQGFQWVRTEPEIDAKRQEELRRRRVIVPDIEKGIYPFRGMKLSRADIEWLLATHEDGRGPVIWNDESQRRRNGLDLRGVDLRGEDLSRLPLARIRGGLRFDEWERATPEQRDWASIHLEHCNLFWVHLNQAKLRNSHLEDTNLSWAHMEGADLCAAHLESANLWRTHLEEVHLIGAYLAKANLREVHLEKARLENILLSDELGIGPQMADAQLDDTNLAVVAWSQVKMLADEYQAHARRTKDKATRLDAYERAVRANRQLSVALQNQGLNDTALHFAYRAQVLQRKVFWLRREVGRWLFSSLLALLAGYGYRMWRILAAYLLVVASCAVAYFVIGVYHSPHLTLLQALLESITAFHGRVFYELFTPDTPQIWVTAFEAIAGLIIESVFIAMLTQRFFGK